MEKSSKNNVYLTGPIRRTMIRTAFAMLAGTVAMSGYNIADTYFIGKLPGQTPLAAIGFTFPIIILLGCVFRGLATGLMTPSAQALGAGRNVRAATLVNSGLTLMLLFSITLSLVGVATGRAVLHSLGASGETLEAAKEYMDIWFYGYLTASLCATAGDMLVAIGESKLSALGMFGALFLNIILDPMWIFGFGPIPPLGIRGAAIATVISQVSGTLYFLELLRRRGLVQFRHIPWKVMSRAWVLIVRFGIPAILGMLMIPIGSYVLTRITAEFGDAAVGGCQAAMKLESIAFMFPMSFGISLTPMISQNFGAGQYLRIKQCMRFAMTFAFCVLLFMAILFFLFAEPLVSLFTSEPEIKANMILYMHIIPWSFWAVEVHRFSGFTFMGCGHPKFSAFLNIYRVLLLLVPFSLLALYFFRSYGLSSVLYARAFADGIAAISAAIMANMMVRRLVRTGK
ncbi:MAG: MATE family efflux transporter [Lentisphaeria bacterium]|nr:MATE family efflux transporter [Lentisphaeria bacterium]